MNDSCCADLIIVGAGIAGACAAYFAGRAGMSVVVIDANEQRASNVPTALINPVRGREGRVIPDGPRGARFTFGLIADLVQAGHVIPHGKGLWRPVPDAATQARWVRSFPADLPHTWHTPVLPHLNLRHHEAEPWHAAAYFPEAGWLDTGAFLTALLHKQAQIIPATVADIRPQSVTLGDGTTLHAKHVLWCGGAYGASRLNVKARYSPGSVAILRGTPCAEPVSTGIYCTPWVAEKEGGQPRSVIGPTSEARTDHFPLMPVPEVAMQQLLARANAMFNYPVEMLKQWRGVRLSRADFPINLLHLGPYGGRGFLMAPLQANEMIATLR